jgi:hypothetical protein
MGASDPVMPLQSLRMLFEFVQILYWLSLSTWFGGVLFVLLAPPIIHKTVRESNPILPLVLSVNLEGQHGTLLAGSIVSNLLGPVIKAELICAAGMFVAIIGQWLHASADGLDLIVPILRSAMYLAAVIFVIYNYRSVWPKALQYRQEYLDNADDPDKANPALDLFDKYQNESLIIVRNVLFLLLGIILFSANIGNSAASSFLFH